MATERDYIFGAMILNRAVFQGYMGPGRSEKDREDFFAATGEVALRIAQIKSVAPSLGWLEIKRRLERQPSKIDALMNKVGSITIPNFGTHTALEHFQEMDAVLSELMTGSTMPNDPMSDQFSNRLVEKLRANRQAKQLAGKSSTVEAQ